MTMSDFRKVLAAWIAQANSPLGAFPEGTDPAEWVADRFCDWWEPETGDAIEEARGALEELRQSLTLISADDLPVETLEAIATLEGAIDEIQAAFQNASARSRKGPFEFE